MVGTGALTGTIDILKAIAEGQGPSRYLIALGYAGWGEGQLDEEMTRPGWFYHRRKPRRYYSILRPKTDGRRASGPKESIHAFSTVVGAALTFCLFGRAAGLAASAKPHSPEKFAVATTAETMTRDYVDQGHQASPISAARRS